MRSSNSREKSGFLIQVIHRELECVLHQGRAPAQEEVSGMGKKGKSVYGSENSNPRQTWAASVRLGVVSTVLQE